MKISKILAGVVASAVAVSAMAVNVAAVDATAGESGEVAICFAGGDWLAQYWMDGNTYPTTANTAIITGDGQYTVSTSAAAEFEDEETGEMTTAEGTTDLAFAALEVKDGETLFPGMIITIDSVKFDGTEVALAGTPYTSSDDQVTTRVNLYNGWVSDLPEDARTIDGLAADATPAPVDAAVGAWTTMEVTFTVSGTGVEVAADAAEEEVVADAAEEVVADDAAEATDTAADTTTATTDDKASPDTGVEGVAAVAGLAIVAAGAVIIAKNRK